MSHPPYTAYFDRSLRNINGYFTLHQVQEDIRQTRVLFKRLAARSGQRGYEDTSWVRGKSPIPFGTFRLWLTPKNRGQGAGETGIGEFYAISNGADPRRIIHSDKLPSDKPALIREDIGLHGENSLPGSAGCIVLLSDTPTQQHGVQALFDFLWQLGKTLPWIPLKVL